MNVLNNNECMKIIAKKLTDIFGNDYLRENFDRTIVGFSEQLNNANEYMVFVGIKTKQDCPWLPANDKGWTVYAVIRIDRLTGDIVDLQYQNEAA